MRLETTLENGGRRGVGKEMVGRGSNVVNHVWKSMGD